MGFVVLARGEERLVGRDQRNVPLIGEIDQARFRGAFVRRASAFRTMALQFDIEPVAEPALQLFATRQRQRVLAADDGDIKRPVRPAGERDQPRGLAVEPVKLEVRPLLRRRLEISARGKPHQAAIAVVAGGKQHDPRPDMVDRTVADFLIAEIDAERAADDRLDAIARDFFRKFQRTEHVVGVGERQRRLAVLLGQLRQARDRQRTLEQRIGRMNVQVHEGEIGGHGLGLTDWRSDHGLARFSPL